MAKKENATKNFVLRIDAEMMDAIETWAADEFRINYDNSKTRLHKKDFSPGRKIKNIRKKFYFPSDAFLYQY